MTDNPYNRTVVYPLEKPLADDLNQEFSQADRSLRDTLFSLLRGQNGFVGSDFLVQASSPVAMSVVLKAGIGWYDSPTDVPTGIGSVLGLNDLSRYKPVVLLNDLTVAVPAAPGANSRIDLIEVRYNRQTDNPQSRNFLDPNTNAFSPATINKTLDFNVDGTLAYYAAAAVPTTALAYKSGVVAVSPVAPTVDTGYMTLATVNVGTGVVTIVAANITDTRLLIRSTPGAFLHRLVMSAGGTYTPTPGTNRVIVRMAGGGGGGGGTGSTANYAAAGGGASGTAIELGAATAFHTGPITGGAVVIGAGGAGGVGAANGAAGGDTTVTINTVVYTAKGGGGGGQSVGQAAPGLAFAGPLVAGSSAADLTSGYPGGPGISTADGTTASTQGGHGGSNPLGTGGYGASSVGNGGAGSGFGGGGGGAADTGFTTARNGGAGSGGVVIIEEWT